MLSMLGIAVRLRLEVGLGLCGKRERWQAFRRVFGSVCEGKGKGTKNGVVYFECLGEGYGLYARARNITVGDYPEEGMLASNDDP